MFWQKPPVMASYSGQSTAGTLARVYILAQAEQELTITNKFCEWINDLLQWKTQSILHILSNPVYGSIQRLKWPIFR